MIILAGCAKTAPSGDYHGVDKSQPVVMSCPDGIAKCYSMANELCGPRGFDEMERAPSSNVTAAGRLENQRDGRHVYREDLRLEDAYQTITVRCN